MATIIIIAILAFGLALIATENVNKMNKAAVAMFMGVICWLFYIGYGTAFVVSQHAIDFLSFLSNHGVNTDSVKQFVSDNVFFQYVVDAAEIVLFLLATMTIVEVLNNNGCFDFLTDWLRTRSPRRYLCLLAIITFTISANLDNLTTVCLMLGILHRMIADDKQRMILGSVIVVAANCGGAFTVIGDVTSLVLWTGGVVSPTQYAAMAFLPSLAALATVVALCARSLRDRRLSLVRTAPPYRGDDTVLTRTQRLLMLLVGIGGLWFIPTFHRITLLPPFVGALCVLALLWIVNELCNRKLMGSDQMVGKRQPMALQYANIQHMLFFIGLLFTFGAVKETGILKTFVNWGAPYASDYIYVTGGVMGLLSSLTGNITTLLFNVTTYSTDWIQMHPEVVSSLGKDGIYWPLLSFSTALGGGLLCFGTLAGTILMRMENIKLRWFVRHMSGKILAGWGVGMLVFYVVSKCYF